MRKFLLGIGLLITTFSLSAQSDPGDVIDWPCDVLQDSLDLPYFYCDCRETSSVFAFPLETEITDTVWYTATLDDLRQGISAYWFADCSVTMEVFAFCASKKPTFTLTVGPNQMRDIDNTKINQKLDEMGETARLQAQTLTPHIRVYPRGGSGRVYCYPYDQGPHSTCEDPLPLRIGMTYVCDKEENVYRMDWKSIPASGKSFVHWKQKQNKACEIWLTLDSCNGQEVGRTYLSDSLHLYQPDSAMLVNARAAHRSLWLHVQHASNITGRIYFYSNPKYAETALAAVTKKTCYGKTIDVNLRTYSTDTTFVDTIWVARDTLNTQSVKLTFTQPNMEYDTVQVDSATLQRGYRYQPSGTILYQFGDTVVEVVKPKTCTRRIQVTVEPKITEQPPVVDPPVVDPPVVDPPVDPNEALDDVTSATRKAYKNIENGQLIIYIDDQRYNVLGQPIN